MQAKGKQKRKRQKRPMASSAVIAPSHSKNRSMDQFFNLQYPFNQELSFGVPLAADKTEIKNGTLRFRFYIF